MIGEARCGCGQVTIRLTGDPLLRAFCHCTICQRFNRAPFADIVAFPIAGAELQTPERVAFSTFRPPPNVQRGTCTACEAPALEFVRIPLFPKLAMIPAANLDPDALPPPAMHMFYRSRVAEVDDDLPRYHGYVSSQLAFLRGLLRGRRAPS